MCSITTHHQPVVFIVKYSTMSGSLDKIAYFLDREHPSNGKNIEVICCSLQSDTVGKTGGKYTMLQLHNLALDDLKIGHEKGGTIPYKQWPLKTDILCIHCAHGFSWQPLCIPEKYYESSKTYSVSYIICSIGCGVAQIESKKYYDQWHRIFLFRKMLREVFSLDPREMKAAPPRESLSAFGGYMSIEKFREESTRIESCRLIEPPFLLFPIVIEEKISRFGKTGQQILSGDPGQMEYVEYDQEVCVEMECDKATTKDLFGEYLKNTKKKDSPKKGIKEKGNAESKEKDSPSKGFTQKTQAGSLRGRKRKGSDSQTCVNLSNWFMQ
jgi:hypothetical protein